MKKKKDTTVSMPELHGQTEILLQMADVCLGITATGADLKEARRNAYKATGMGRLFQ